MSFSDPIVGGEGDLVRTHIRSPDYVPNVSGWSINRDGSAEFNDITIRGGAIVGGSITIGPSNGPQVVIEADANAGRIEFPTNATQESIPARIVSQVAFDGDPDEQLWVNFTSARSTANTDQADITLKAVALDSSSGAEINIVAPGLGAVSSARVDLANGTVALTGDEVTVEGNTDFDDEIYVGISDLDSNYPNRVARGEIGTGSTNTTIGAVDTEVTNSAIASTFLENGIAYLVDVQIQVFANAGAAAAGTQGIQWKLWDGAVGTTQLGPTIQKYAEGATNNASTEKFSFLFEYAGTTGSKTIRLSAVHVEGAESMRAAYNTQYFMLVHRIGDPLNIANL